MSIIHWNPLTELEDIQSDINRIFDNTVFRRRANAKTELGLWQPVIDVIETKENYQVKAEIPGIAKEDISINVNDSILTIKGEKKQEISEKDTNLLRTERLYGMFQRQLALPQDVDAEKINARFKDGVLELMIPKGEKTKPKEIKIQ